MLKIQPAHLNVRFLFKNLDMIKVKPSMRMNRRYLLLDSASKESVEKMILDYIGILGWAGAAPEFIMSNSRTVLAVNREFVDKIRAAFAVSKEKIKGLKVSGTINGLG